MTNQDYIIITLCLLVLGVTLLLRGKSILWRKKFFHDDNSSTEGAETLPRLSIVMAAQDQGRVLEQHLPRLLSQDYPDEYEVIVVDESSSDDTEDVLKRLKATYPHLYTTFIPASSHYLSRRKLALTIGVKAAKNDWILFIDADCYPQNEQWLRSLAQYCREEVSLILGYAHLQHTNSFLVYENYMQQNYDLCCASSRFPYGYSGHLLMIHKDEFIRDNGFLKNLKFLRGEYGFLAHDYAQRGVVRLALATESHIIRKQPFHRVLRNERMYRMATNSHLSYGLFNATRHLFTSFLPYLNLITYLSVCYLGWEQQPLWYAIGISCLLIALCWRMWIGYRSIKCLGENLSPWVLPFFDLFSFWKMIIDGLRYLFADKNDFVRK